MSEKTFKIVNGDMSDGYHTFDELYEHRCTLFLALCNLMAVINVGAATEREVIKSKLHADGSEYEGWFIAGIHLRDGWISYHLPNKLWDQMKVPEVEKFVEWDGHTPQDVIDRLLSHFGE